MDAVGYVTNMYVCSYDVGAETKPMVTCEGQATPLLPPSH